MLLDLSKLSKRTVSIPIKNNIAHPLVATGHLIIEQNILSSMVKARGHVVIMGDSELSEIISEQGNIFLLYGSVRNNKILAQGNIYMKFCTLSKVQAIQDIIIENSILQSDLEAGRKIVGESMDSSIVAGKAIAQESISIAKIGRENTKTTIILRQLSGFIETQEIAGEIDLTFSRQHLVIKKPIKNLRKIFWKDREFCFEFASGKVIGWEELSKTLS